MSYMYLDILRKYKCDISEIVYSIAYTAVSVLIKNMYDALYWACTKIVAQPFEKIEIII